MTLADLKRGERAQIDRVDTGDPGVQRLMVMGLVEGSQIEFVGTSFGGDPIELRVYGSAISLRRAQAQHFHVTPNQ